MLVMHDPDEHAPFPHVFVRAANGDEFVICAVCSHWTGRPVDSCKCRVSCHAQIRAQNAGDPAPGMVDLAVSSSHIPDTGGHDHEHANPARFPARRASSAEPARPARRARQPTRRSGTRKATGQ